MIKNYREENNEPCWQFHYTSETEYERKPNGIALRSASYQRKNQINWRVPVYSVLKCAIKRGERSLLKCFRYARTSAFYLRTLLTSLYSTKRNNLQNCNQNFPAQGIKAMVSFLLSISVAAHINIPCYCAFNLLPI